MTSTNFNVGLDGSTRSTSRVLKPPGGGHTDIFGASEPEAPRGRKHAQTSSIVLGSENCNEEKPTNGTSAHVTDRNENKTELETREAPVRAAEPQVDNQPKQEAPNAEPQKMEAPKRVRVPPGGFSSGLW